MTRPVAIMIGPPGAGKTTVGRLLAAELGVQFRDTDADIEATAGKPVPDIFVEDGEDHFRELEHAAVAAAVAGHPGVLAVGGGAVMHEGTRDLLAGHTVVYLKVGLPDALDRVGLNAARPLLAFNPRSRLRQLMAERVPVYEGLAVRIVDTSGREPAEIVTELVKELR